MVGPPPVSREREFDVIVVNDNLTVAQGPLIPEIINYLIHIFHVFSVPQLVGDGTVKGPTSSVFPVIGVYIDEDDRDPLVRRLLEKKLHQFLWCVKILSLSLSLRHGC